MKERLLEFLKSENKSSAQFAEEIGVQPSGISHILSGRNNPSLDFVLKMLEKYQFLSTDWLLFGKGTMYKDPKMQSLFDDTDIFDRKPDAKEYSNATESQIIEQNLIEKEQVRMNAADREINEKSSISRIVMFFADSSFKEYLPQK
jgi:transcriptional regulator with XRE-family HTH domain